MLTAKENEVLCRVEGDAPMGQLMRRHWIPALLSEQVAEPDGNPVRLSLLGEKLVAFRDSHGRLGVLGEMCPLSRYASTVVGLAPVAALPSLLLRRVTSNDGISPISPPEPESVCAGEVGSMRVDISTYAPSARTWS